MNSKWITFAVSSLTDFIISAGGCLTTAMVATGGSTALPSTATIIFSVVTGLVATARGAQKMLSPAVVPGSPP